jgi:predicted nucleic acid-binding Zn ribbon protein
MLPIQNFSTGVLAEIIRRQPPSSQRTAFAWQLAVGHALSRVTTVELAEGVLTVRSRDSRWLREVERARPAVLEKMQNLLGKSEVRKLQFGARDSGLGTRDSGFGTRDSGLGTRDSGFGIRD